MYDSIYIPSDDEVRKLEAERIEGLYTEGLRRKSVVTKEMESGQRYDRHFITKTFGSLVAGGVLVHRMNGTTGGLSYNEYYQDWRETVMGALSSSIVPSYLKLDFSSLPDVLVSEKYSHDYYEEITKRALETFDMALEKLLNIIKQLPDTKTQPKSEAISMSYGIFALTVSGGVLKNGIRIEMPPKQSKLMSALIKKVGEPLSRGDCIDILWNEDDATEGFLENPKHTTEYIHKQLSNHVHKLNTLLRDGVDKKQYVHKASDERGYYLSS